MGKFADELKTKVKDHRCEGKDIEARDNMLERTVGFACLGCGAEWHFPVAMLRDEGEVLKKFFRSAEGRQKVAESLV